MRQTHQRVKRRQGVVKPPFQKPQPDDQRSLDTRQAFLEIGIIRLTYLVSYRDRLPLKNAASA